MSKIPIFDSLTHPTPNGNWLGNQWCGQNTLEQTLTSMQENNIQWGFAVGMGEGVGGYDETGYAAFIKNGSDKLFPVAFVDFNKLGAGTSIEAHLTNLRNLGYVGIKIHPRLSRISLANNLLPDIIRFANKLKLVVLLCTYFWGKYPSLHENSPEQLSALLCEVPEEKLILLHGGAVRLLEIAEVARQFPQTLLDLSFTLCKYEGSSIDLDIRYLFNNFDRRICIGSDSPEFDQCKLRERFEFFAEGLSQVKKENIAYKNIYAHMGTS